LSNVTAIACGTYHDLALKSDGTVAGWGDNTYGQVMTNNMPTNAVAIACGLNHSLALRADDTMVAWGDSSYGKTTVPANATNIIAIAAVTIIASPCAPTARWSIGSNQLQPVSYPARFEQHCGYFRRRQS